MRWIAANCLVIRPRRHVGSPSQNRTEAYRVRADCSATELRTAARLTESGFGDMALSLAGQIDGSESVIVAAVLSQLNVASVGTAALLLQGCHQRREFH